MFLRELSTLLFVYSLLIAQTDRKGIAPGPDRAEGEGPFKRLVIRGAIVIDGAGAPPRGPVDIVIEGNRISSIVGVGYPGVPIDENRRPKKGDCRGKYSHLLTRKIRRLENNDARTIVKTNLDRFVGQHAW